MRLARLVNLFIYCQGACQLCLFIAREVATTTKPSHGLIKIKPVRRPIGGIFVNQIKMVGETGDLMFTGLYDHKIEVYNLLIKA